MMRSNFCSNVSLADEEHSADTMYMVFPIFVSVIVGFIEAPPAPMFIHGGKQVDEKYEINAQERDALKI